MESQSILGFETASKYTGEGKGGPCPYEEGSHDPPLPKTPY